MLDKRHLIPNSSTQKADKKNNSVIKVVIADDHKIFRDGIKKAFSQWKDIKIIGEAENGSHLLKLLGNIKADIVLLDIRMPVMDDIATLPEIIKHHPQLKVIILSMYDDDEMISKMMNLGASSYLIKTTDPKKIKEAIQIVCKKDFYHSAKIKNAMLKNLHFEEKSKSLKPTEERKKSVKRNNINALSNKNMVKLFSLSTSILKYINHDLSGEKGMLFLTLSKIKEELRQGKIKQIDRKNILELNKLNKRALNVISNIDSITNVLKNHFHWQSSNGTIDFNKLFISRPIEIVEIVQKRFTHVNIEVHRSTLKSLQIVYPPNILLAILLELTGNSEKKTLRDPNVIIKWKMTDGRFQCEVHDNGPGFVGLRSVKYIPLGLILSNTDTKSNKIGLSLINRTIIDSGGHLFFSTSKLLNGAMVYFEFPVIDFKLKTSVKNEKK